MAADVTSGGNNLHNVNKEHNLEWDLCISLLPSRSLLLIEPGQHIYSYTETIYTQRRLSYKQVVHALKRKTFLMSSRSARARACPMSPELFFTLFISAESDVLRWTRAAISVLHRCPVEQGCPACWAGLMVAQQEADFAVVSADQLVSHRHLRSLGCCAWQRMGLVGIADLAAVDSQLAVCVQACHMASSNFEESVVELYSASKVCSAGCSGPDSLEVVVGLAAVALAAVLRTVSAADHSQEGNQLVAQMEEALRAADTHTAPVVVALHRSRIAAVEEERLALTFLSTQVRSRLPGLGCRTLQTAHRGCYGCA